MMHSHILTKAQVVCHIASGRLSATTPAVPVGPFAELLSGVLHSRLLLLRVVQPLRGGEYHAGVAAVLSHELVPEARFGGLTRLLGVHRIDSVILMAST
eukprot:COSAG06_NODE_5833_length_3253_cov_2.254597_1_plen_99_part_00